MRNTKNNLLVLILLMATLGIQACGGLCGNGRLGKCKNRVLHPLDPQMEEYFSGYKPGSYWVYANQDTTKVDSVYISQYEELITGEECECDEVVWNNFLLHTTFFDKNRDAEVFYGTSSQNFATAFSIQSRDRDISLITQTDTIGCTTCKLTTEGNFKLWKDNDEIIEEIIRYTSINNNEVIFGKNIGLVQFVDLVDTQDTLRLIRYHIEE